MNDHISRSAEFDHPRYWSFQRTSGIPYGAFGRNRRSVLRWFADVVIARPHRTVFLFVIALGVASIFI